MEILWSGGCKATRHGDNGYGIYIYDGSLVRNYTGTKKKVLKLTKEENKMDNTRAKEFISKDLKTGDRAVIADGRNLLIIKSTSSNGFALYDDSEMIYVCKSQYYDTDFNYYGIGGALININQIFSADGVLKWERIEEIEMTMEEVNQMAIKAIGKKVKVVEKKEQ